MTEEKIFLLFEDTYDGDYLRFIWKEKPSLFELAEAIGKDFPSKDDNITLFIVKLWQGERASLSKHDNSWKLKHIAFGRVEE